MQHARRMSFVFTFGLVCLSLASTSRADDPAYVAELTKVVVENSRANQEKDLDAAMATIHPNSPSYAPTKQMSKQLFAALDLNYEVTSFKYIGADDTYAVARVSMQTKKKNDGRDFQDNETQLMIVFRKDGDKWKVWSQSILERKNL